MKKKRMRVICIVSVMSILFTSCCLSHDWQEATCVSSKTCSECGKIEGEALGHAWQEATCIKPKTCSVCGETEGETLAAHAWQEATCTKPKTCSVCGESEGETIPHDFNAEGICSMCQMTKIALTWQNVGDYLHATYSLESSGSNYHITVTVAPVSSSYSFQDAQVHIGMNLYENNGTLLYDAPLDFNFDDCEQFYDLDNEGNLTIEGHFPKNYNLDDLRPIQIYDAKGFCIKN